MKYHSKTFALDDGVLAALATLKTDYGSVNKGLRAILIEGGVAPAADDDEPILGDTFEARHSRAAEALQSASSQSPSALVVNHCVHCDKDFPKPDGSKPSTMCNLCGRDGHQPWGVCKKCATDAEIERRRAASTACDTSNIDLNPDWGA